MARTTYRNRPTLRDIAEITGVSTATVSYVLNGKGSVGANIQKLVLETAKEVGYRANHAAKATRTGQTLSIGLILPDLKNPYFPQLAQVVQSAARRAGYAVFLVDSEENEDIEREGAEDLISRGVEGLIWCPATEHDSLSEYRIDVPIVVVDRPLPNYDTISSDYYSGGRLLSDHILSLGHKRIGMIVGPQSLSSAKLRRDGFVDHLDGKAQVEWEVENAFSIDLSNETRARLGDLEVSAIVCGNDFIAIGVMRALHELGRSVPQDVSVVGFDDIPWARFSIPGLATVRQPFSKLGNEAAALLIRRITGDDAPQVNMSLDMRLVTRGSLRKASSDTR